MRVHNKLIAEFIGTFWLVFAGCGSAVLAAGLVNGDGIHIGIGYIGVSLAFGLTVLTMAYAVGPVSGGHFNPAVSVGLFVGGRFSGGQLVPYMIAQVLGGIAAAFLLAAIVNGSPDYEIGGFATNGYGAASPHGFNMFAVLIMEVVMTAVFIFIILGATDERAGTAAGFAPIAIGLGLTLIHLVSIPVSNTSVNPARSTGPAIITMLSGDAVAIQQLWIFWVAPIVGGVLGAIVYKTTLAGGKFDAELQRDAEVHKNA